MPRSKVSSALIDQWLDQLAALAVDQGAGPRHRRRTRSLRQQWVDWLLASTDARSACSPPDSSQNTDTR